MKKTLVLAFFLAGFTGLSGEELKLRGADLRAYLIGTWVDAENAAKADITSEQTFRENGTYEGKVVMRTRNLFGRVSEQRLVFSGTWRVEGDVCIETTERMEPQISDVPHTGKYRIWHVSASTHRSTNVETNETSVHRRKTRTENGSPSAEPKRSG